MKPIILLLFTLISLSGFAQVDRTKAPTPTPAREIKIGDYQSFTLKNGLQVFVVENHKLPRVQFSLELRNNPILEGDKAGFVELTGDLIGTGTKTRTKAQLDEEVDFIGASLNTSSNGIFASSLSKHTEKLMSLMTDVLLNPAMSADELEKLKKLKLSELAASKDEPDAIAANVRGALVYGKNHPYGEIITEQTVEAVSLEDCKKYYATYFKPNNAYLAIVGDINLKSAKELVEKFLDKWSKAEVVNPTYAIPKAPEKTFLALVDRPASVQSVISVAYPLELFPGTPDVVKATVLNQILGDGFSSRLNQNLREAKGYTYGAGSSLRSDPLIGSFNARASVRNEVTDSAVVEFLHELKRISNDPVEDNELAAAKADIAGSFGRSLENPQTVARFAINTAKYNLPKDYYNTYVKRIGAVSKEEVQAAAKKFIHPDNAYIIVVGKGAEIAKSLEAFGAVKYYNINGDSYVPSKTSPVPAGMTADKVFEKYFQALGGATKLKTITSLKSKGKASVPGAELQINTTQKAPNKIVVEVLVNGAMQVQRMVSNGKEVSMMSMGQKAPVDAETKEQTLFEANLIPELVYKEAGVKVALKGIEAMDANEVYVIDYTFPSGSKSTAYFDTQTGLKVKSTRESDSPQGKISVATTYSDYKEFGGVKFPTVVTQSMGPQTLNMIAETIEVNVPVDDSVFKID